MEKTAIKSDTVRESPPPPLAPLHFAPRYATKFSFMCVYIAFTMGADLLALIFALVVPQCWFRMRKKYEGIPGATKVDIEVQDAYASTMGRSILDIVNSMHIFFNLIYQPIIDAMVRRREEDEETRT